MNKESNTITPEDYFGSLSASGVEHAPLIQAINNLTDQAYDTRILSVLKAPNPPQLPKSFYENLGVATAEKMQERVRYEASHLKAESRAALYALMEQIHLPQPSKTPLSESSENPLPKSSGEALRDLNLLLANGTNNVQTEVSMVLRKLKRGDLLKRLAQEMEKNKDQLPQQFLSNEKEISTVLENLSHYNEKSRLEGQEITLPEQFYTLMGKAMDALKEEIYPVMIEKQALRDARKDQRGVRKNTKKWADTTAPSSPIIPPARHEKLGNLTYLNEEETKRFSAQSAIDLHPTNTLPKEVMVAQNISGYETFFLSQDNAPSRPKPIEFNGTSNAVTNNIYIDILPAQPSVRNSENIHEGANYHPLQINIADAPPLAPSTGKPIISDASPLTAEEKASYHAHEIIAGAETKGKYWQNREGIDYTFKVRANSTEGNITKRFASAEEFDQMREAIDDKIHNLTRKNVLTFEKVQEAIEETLKQKKKEGLAVT